MFQKICSSHCLAETQCEVCSCQKRWSEESTNLFPPEDDDNPHHNDDSRAADQTVKPREMLDLFDTQPQLWRRKCDSESIQYTSYVNQVAKKI